MLIGLGPRITKHGERVGRRITPEYQAWKNMRRRCYEPTNKRYARYGGRGITVCERWAEFANFLADMGRRPGPGFSIERIDVHGNYEPTNCRWATQKEQCRNRTSNRIVLFQGQRMTLVEAAERSGLSYAVVRARLSRLGWDLDDALTRKHRYAP